MEGEIVYDFKDPECDTLYFVESGKLMVQAKVTITQENVIPMGKNAWEKTTKETDVHYFVRQIDSGGYFGLEELIDKAVLKMRGRTEMAETVVRQLRVTTMSNCKLLYMT